MTYTWEQAEADSKIAEQMEQQLRGAGWQYVEFQARRGAGLIELKAETPHGEFEANARRAAHLEPRRVQELMTLARHLPLLEQRRPDSQRDALKMIKAEQSPTPRETPNSEKEKEVKFDTGAIMVSIGFPSQKNHLIDGRNWIRANCDPSVWETTEAFEVAAVKALAALHPERAAEHAAATKKAVPETAKAKFDKALQAALAVEIADMHKQFAEQLQEAKEQLSIKIQEAEAEREAAFQYRLGIDSHMTMEEFHLVRNCLHPDRAPADRRERFEKAFVIFNRLEKTVNTKAPISILRRHGWEKASPYYKSH